MSRRLGRIGLARLRDGVSERDLAVASLVAELRLMSGQQIQELHFPVEAFASAETAARTCRRVLARLSRDRLLVRLDRRIGGLHAGSAGTVCGLGPVGYRLTEPEGRTRPRHWEPTDRFVDHALAVSQLAVDLTLLGRAGSVEILALQGEPRCWRHAPGQSTGVASLRPDLYIALGIGELEWRWFVEVDMSTTHLPALLRKCHLYESYYRSGTEQAAHGVFPRVLWATPNKQRADHLRRAIATSSQLTSALFLVTTADNAPGVLRGGEV